MDRDDAASVSPPTRGAVTSSSSFSSSSSPPASASVSASPTAANTTPVAATAAPLARSVSQTSAASSTRSHRSLRRGGGGGSNAGSRRASSRVPTRSSSQNPQPHVGSSSASVTSEDSKSLTSFPSFSPKAPSSASPSLLPSASRPRLAGPTASTASLVDSLLAADEGRPSQSLSLSVTAPSTSTAAVAAASASASTSASAGRSALFDDDAPAIIPSDLHQADDAHVARLIGKHGAIALVRQLAEDLARRDTQVAALRARAADRERSLRKIILECGLSSLDLETRLRTLEQEQEARLAAAAANTSIPAAHTRRVSDLVSDAMSDDHSPRQVSSDYYYNDATIRAASSAASALSAKDAGNSKPASATGTPKGWKDYLFGGTTKKANGSESGTQTPQTPSQLQKKTTALRVTSSGDRRPTITDDFFQPPPTSSTDAAADDTRPIRSASRASSVHSAATSQSGRKPSLASLALRLVGGGGSDSQDASGNEGSASASAAASLRSASGVASRRPGPPSATLGRSTRASTLQGGGNGGSVGPKSRMSMRRTTSSAVLSGAGAVAALNGGALPQAIPGRGAGGAGAGKTNSKTSGKTTNGSGHRHQGSSGGGSGGGSGANERWGGEMMDASPASDGAAALRRTTYFPVEMDTILPLDVQPPTLTHMYNRYNSSGHLIDRFGFIYDQRRKKRQREAAQVAQVAQVARQAKRGSRHSEMLDTAGGRASRNGRPSPSHLVGGDEEADVVVVGGDDDQASVGDASSLKNDNDADSTDRPPSLASTSAPDKDPNTAPPDSIPKRWQDYLKIATFPTELLSHTPAMSDSRIEVITEDSSSSVSDATGPKSPGFIASDGRGFVPPSTGAMAAATTAATTTTTTTNATASATSLTGVTGLDTDSIASSTNTADMPADQKQLTKKKAHQQQQPPPPAKEDVEPVRLLLQQLSELHDTLQKERTVRWNEFLRKVRAERRREGEMMALAAVENSNNGTTNTSNRFLHATAIMPETRLADGEIVGVAGLGNKGKLGRAKWNEFRALVLGGIPVVLRAKVWSECTGATSLRVPGAYDDLVAGRDGDNDNDDNSPGAEDRADVVAQIQADIYRTLTDNIFFREGPGTAKLNEVLLAYARRNPDVGYCQGMNLIAANLLLVTPSAEDAFWLLASIVETILPVGYYDHSLAASRADQQVLRAYVADVLPRLSAHFDALAIDLETMTFQWFLSVFTDCLSAEVLFRVWDVVFCLNDGSVFLFQVALALLKLNEAALLRCETPAEIYTYINHQMTNHAISIDGLIQASEALRKLVRREDVEARRVVAMDAERALVAARAAAVAEAKATRQQKIAARELAARELAALEVAAAPETAIAPTTAEAESTTTG